jgi:DNA-binding MarR family transcriptional regulator
MFKRKMDERAKEMNLTSVQLRVLGEVSLTESMGVEEINQKNLEKFEKVTHPSMTGIIQRLEEPWFHYMQSKSYRLSL